MHNGENHLPTPSGLCVRAIWRYPVKAMLGQAVKASWIDHRGCLGDRRWLVVDLATGQRIANKRCPNHPELRACRAELLTEEVGARAARAALQVTLPDGARARGAEIDGALSELLGRPVGLVELDATATGVLGAPAAHQDVAPLHLITVQTLDHLRSLASESDWDVRRFRPNLLLDYGQEPAGGVAESAEVDGAAESAGFDGAAESAGFDGAAESAGFLEDRLIGRSLLGADGLELALTFPTARCVVPTRAHGELPPDRRILRTVVTHHRVDLGRFGRQGCAGAYAEVAHPGVLQVGDRLTVGAAPLAPRAAIDATIARLVALIEGA